MVEIVFDWFCRPAMREIVAAAKASAGVELDDDVVEKTIEMDPLTSYLKPSMQQDLEKVSLVILCVERNVSLACISSLVLWCIQILLSFAANWNFFGAEAFVWGVIVSLVL
jgi:hypothetical protein